MSFNHAIENRRSIYHLTGESTISDETLQEILTHSINYSPSAFNSQTSRVVLLKGAEHKALWSIAMETLRKIVPADAFAATENKINGFAAAYGSLLFFEDQEAVSALQSQFPLYADNFPVWSSQHSAILQFVIWTAFSEVGMGASLQHYNPLIDDQVKAKWHLPESWRLIAQMPFGKTGSQPGEKSFMPINERLWVYGE